MSNVAFSERTAQNNMRIFENRATLKSANVADLTEAYQMFVRQSQWLAIRKKAGRKIDPETAEVMWGYEKTGDPYGLDPELPDEPVQGGRAYFARSPGSDIWVWFGDLPDATEDALWKKHKASLAFPAGLPIEFFAGRYKDQDSPQESRAPRVCAQ
jgi:hypothetical protein